MMPHSTRGRVLGAGLAVLALALIPAGMTWPDPQPGASMPGLLGGVVQVAAALVAITVAAAIVFVAGRAAAPTAHHAARTVRAWHQRRRAHRDDRAQTTAHTDQESLNGAQPALKRAARVLVLVMAVVVVAVAVFALALNFDHGRELAELNGERGWRSHIWPLTIDGLLIASSLVGLVRRLLGLSVGFRARAAFVIGIVASAGANIVLALHDPLTGWALAETIGVKTSPTLALLLTHEMGLQLIAYYARITDAFGTEGPNPAVLAAERRAAAAEAQARQAADTAAQRIEAFAAQAREETAQHEGRIEELQHELNTVRAEAEPRTAELQQLRLELAELSQLDNADDRTPADYLQIQALAEWWVQHERPARPSESLVGDIVRMFGVSARWTQQHVPAAKEQRRQLQLA